MQPQTHRENVLHTTISDVRLVMVGLVPASRSSGFAMVASIFIIGISVVLFVYWLRYSCVMLLRSAQERAEMVTVEDQRFNVSAVLERLHAEADLEPLEHALDRDPDLGLVGVGGDDEGVLALVEQPVALLRDHRPQQDVPLVAVPAHLAPS